jgi:hypothetical protein
MSLPENINEQNPKGHHYCIVQCHAPASSVTRFSSPGVKKTTTLHLYLQFTPRNFLQWQHNKTAKQKQKKKMLT